MSLVLMVPALAHAAVLENPGNGSFYSGVGVVSGWKCTANGPLTVRFNTGPPIPLAYGNERSDVRDAGACPSAHVGFVSIMNWGELGDGVHTAVVYDDGVEFARSTFEVATTGESFVTGAEGECRVEDFPAPGESMSFAWNEATQHLEMRSENGLEGDGRNGILYCCQFVVNYCAVGILWHEMIEEKISWEKYVARERLGKGCSPELVLDYQNPNRGHNVYRAIHSYTEESEQTIPGVRPSTPEQRCHTAYQKVLSGDERYLRLEDMHIHHEEDALLNELGRRLQASHQSACSRDSLTHPPYADEVEVQWDNREQLECASGVPPYRWGRDCHAPFGSPGDGEWKPSPPKQLERIGDSAGRMTNAPGVPRNVRVTEVGTDFVALAWDAPVGGGVVSYNIYYHSPNGPEDLLGNVSIPTGTVVPGECYRVAAVNAAGVEGEKSPEVCAQTQQPPDVGSGSGGPAVLENPGNGSFYSGVGVVSGWKCTANGSLTVRFNGGPSIPLAYGNARADVRDAGACPSTHVGFVSIMNWGELGDGVHTAVVYDDGVEFARSTFEVATTGESFVRGAEGECRVEDFPAPGESMSFAWNEATQHLEMIGDSAEALGKPWSEATIVQLGSDTRGTLKQEDDINYYRLDISRAGTVTVDTTGNTDTVGQLRTGPTGTSPDGREVGRDDGTGDGNNFRISLQVSAGTYYLLVSGRTPGDYILRVRFTATPACASDDHGSTPDSATMLGLDTTVQGRLECESDEDYFVVNVPREGILDVKIWGHAPLMDADILRVTDLTNISPAQPPLHTTIRVPTGMYYIRTRPTSIAAYRGAEANYRVKVRLYPPDDDHGDGTPEGGPRTVLRPPAEVAGIIQIYMPTCAREIGGSTALQYNCTEGDGFVIELPEYEQVNADEWRKYRLTIRSEARLEANARLDGTHRELEVKQTTNRTEDYVYEIEYDHGDLLPEEYTNRTREAERIILSLEGGGGIHNTGRYNIEVRARVRADEPQGSAIVEECKRCLLSGRVYEVCADAFDTTLSVPIKGSQCIATATDFYDIECGGDEPFWWWMPLTHQDVKDTCAEAAADPNTEDCSGDILEKSCAVHTHQCDDAIAGRCDPYF